MNFEHMTLSTKSFFLYGNQTPSLSPKVSRGSLDLDHITTDLKKAQSLSYFRAPLTPTKGKTLHSVKTPVSSSPTNSKESAHEVIPLQVNSEFSNAEQELLSAQLKRPSTIQYSNIILHNHTKLIEKKYQSLKNN